MEIFRKLQLFLKLTNFSATKALIIYLYSKNSFRLFLLAKKLSFCAHFSSFFPSVALLCNLKKPSTGHKITDFRYNPKSLNELELTKEFL